MGSGIIDYTSCEVLGCSERELLNGPAEREIEVRIVIRETDEEVGKLTTTDLSEDAKLIQLVEIGPHKTQVNVVFGNDKSLSDVLEALKLKESAFEAARAAFYGA
ncbi:hypothetical protein AGMMS49957_01850 [Synergistales bacterium]|nr:hypothetical protein AGMMS49957_01850 [Synergistales bacterium]